MIPLSSDGLIPENGFNVCLAEWINTSLGSFFINDLIIESSEIKVARITGRIKYINEQDDSINAKEDLRDIAEDFGPGNT